MTTYAVLLTYKTTNASGTPSEGNRELESGLTLEQALAAQMRLEPAYRWRRDGEWNLKLTVAEEYGS